MGKKASKPNVDKVVERINKLLKEMDEFRNREVKRLSDEFDRRMDEFHELQVSVMERLGISSDKDGASKKKKSSGSSAKPKKAAKATKTDKPAKKSATKKTAAKKPAAKKAAASAKPADSSDLTRVKGIGPATAKKMKDAGITDISQIANPSAADEEKLASFSNVKGFSTFSAEAKKVL